MTLREKVLPDRASDRHCDVTENRKQIVNVIMRMSLARSVFRCAILTLPLTAGAVQAADIPEDRLQDVVIACAMPESVACIDSLQAVLAAFPDVPPSLVVGALAAELAFLANEAMTGRAPAEAAHLGSALLALSRFSGSLGLSSLQETIAAISQAVAAGDIVDIGAIAAGDGNGDGAPDQPASAT